MPRLFPAMLFLSASLVVASCSTGARTEDVGTTGPASTPTSTSSPNSSTAGGGLRPTSTTGRSTATATATAPPNPTTGAMAPSGDPSACPVIEEAETGHVQRAELVETSGLAASRRHEGVLWAINDSGRQAGLYAFDQGGRDLGFFALVGNGAAITTLDVEDLAIIDGTLYLADIGDNARRRETVVIYAVDEPDPGGDADADVTRTIEIRYPDGPTDAEALVADVVSGELLLLSKDLDDGQATTRIYTVPLTSTEGDVVEATLAGELDVAALTAGSNGFSLSSLLFPGAVTGADLGPDDDLVALRTYGSVWLYRRDLGTSVAEALLSTVPCEVGSAAEQQGEAVAFLPPVAGDEATSDGRLIRYVTVSEGSNPPVNLRVAELSP